MADANTGVQTTFSFYDKATEAPGVVAGAIHHAIGVTGIYIKAGVDAGVDAAATHGPAFVSDAGDKLVWAAGATAGAVCTYGPPAAKAVVGCALLIVGVGGAGVAGACNGVYEYMYPARV